MTTLTTPTRLAFSPAPNARDSYAELLAASQRAAWSLDDLLPALTPLDFERPFLPESLVRAERLEFLAPRERLALNHVRAHAYLRLFGVIEEAILPFVLDHARPQLARDDHRTRALLQMAGEEAKHIHLFRGFEQEFARGFGTECGVIGPSSDIAAAILAHDPLGVALAILQIEWMTQRHWLDAAREDETLDPRFKSLLRHHWAEEAQHAKLDAKMVEALASERSPEEIERGFEAYLAIGAFLDSGLASQVELDLASLERACGRTFSESERARFTEVQRAANRWTYLGSGMTHPRFIASVESLGRKHAEKLADVARAFA